MSLWRFDPFVFDSRSGELSRRGQSPVMLRHKLAQLLTYLLTHRDRPVSKEELLDALWQHGDYRERSLTQSIRELRQALGDSAANPRYIRTLPQRGYQWIGEVSASEPAMSVTTSSRRPWVPGGVLLFCVTLIAVTVLWWQAGSAPTKESPDSAIPSVLVLPFRNNTGDTSLDWVQLGYADMLAKTMAQSGSVRVIPPAAASQLLASGGLEWPTLPVYIEGILREQRLDQALIASVRIHNQAQVLDFQLIDRHGDVQQGAITYPSLSNATDQVAAQLLSVIAPEAHVSTPAQALPGDSPEAELARRVLAQGVSALHTNGPIRAGELLQAADLLVSDDPWVAAYRAQAQLLTGQWRQANDSLKKLKRRADTPSLQAYVHYWLAQLAFRRGQHNKGEPLLRQAIQAAENSGRVDLLADSYRLSAQIAWQTMKWSEFSRWRQKAENVLPNNANLSVEADRLYYLGNPVSQGLDTFPGEDPARSAQLVERAHRFYVDLGYRPKIAASELSLARNESLPVDRRASLLTSAIEHYQSLGQPYELTQALIYASYFYLQRHQGGQAEQYIDKAFQAASQLEAPHRLTDTLHLYKAFSLLDQGLDQTHRGLHGANPQKLQEAVAAFNHLLQPKTSPMIRANGLVLQGWGLEALGQSQKALDNYAQAMSLSEAISLDTNYGYAVYSAMHVHLKKGDYQSVLKLGDRPVSTRQQLAYLARAHYELKHFEKAVNTLTQMHDTFPTQWTNSDKKQLALYKAAVNGTKHPLPEALPAHAIYCETDWMVALE